jgi:hypothetical protein
VQYGRNFSICDSPAGAGGKTKQGFVARRASKKMVFLPLPPARYVLKFQTLVSIFEFISKLGVSCPVMS